MIGKITKAIAAISLLTLAACGDDDSSPPTTEGDYVAPEPTTDPEPYDSTSLVVRADGSKIECVYYQENVTCDWDTVIP